MELTGQKIIQFRIAITEGFDRAIERGCNEFTGHRHRGSDGKNSD